MKRLRIGDTPKMGTGLTVAMEHSREAIILTGCCLNQVHYWDGLVTTWRAPLRFPISVKKPALCPTSASSTHPCITEGTLSVEEDEKQQ